MRLAKLRLQGFRCFGESTSLTFEDLSALVGANGTGKTAILMALVRMFGATNAQRTLIKEDFNVDPTAPPPTELALVLDAIFEFPELAEDSAEESSAIPECLRHITLTESGPVPECRIMLKAMWRQTAAEDGDIEQTLHWVDSSEETPPEDALHRLSGVERSLIQAFYVPATRDAVRELRAVSGTILTRVLQRIPWSDAVKKAVQDGTRTLADTLRGEAGLQSLEGLLGRHWDDLRADDRQPVFSFSEDELPGVLRKLDTRLERGDGTVETVGFLSEGERSLMYFALVQSALAFEQKPVAAAGTPALVDTAAPVLTLLLVEEPENHLAPQYLGRILKSLRGVIETGGAQVFVTSHSASLMRRVEPTEIRHFRVDSPGSHEISELTLPEDSDEAFKYVREAVRSYPELYFARAIVLCEGASEEVVLPKVARALDLDVDPRFVAVVPLGGRHVHHFWRLLTALQIPYVTLVDLDVERNGGGWARVHSLLDQLVALGENRKDLLAPLTEAEFAEMPKWVVESSGDDALESWVEHLENKFSIFLSDPLDFDLLLLSAFEATYKGLAPRGGGPRLPTKPADRAKREAAAAAAVLGAEGGDGALFPPELRELFPWYSYLFIGRGKPATHAAAFAELDDTAVRSGCPEVLSRLVERIKQICA